MATTGTTIFDNVTDIGVRLAKLEADIEYLKSNYDDFFLCVMGMVVFFMQAGFGFLEAGTVRSKNTTNILFKNVLNSSICAIFYWACGWAFAFGPRDWPGRPFCGLDEFFSAYAAPERFSSWFFQYSFAATSSTIVSGGVAERTEVVAYFVYSAVYTAITYPVISHWTWDSHGWLAFAGWHKSGSMQDFAGSSVVHMGGGVCALVGTVILGPRTRFVTLGGFMLMFAFFAFNGGSRLTLKEKYAGQDVALAMYNTILTGASAGLTAVFITRLLGTRQWLTRHTLEQMTIPSV